MSQAQPIPPELVPRAVGEAFSGVQEHYHKLAVFVWDDGSRVDRLAAAIADAGRPVLSVGAGLTAQLIETPPRRRPTQVLFALESLLADYGSEVVLLNIEVLMEPSLRADAMGLLKAMSRKQSIVALWPGRREGNDLVYASADHPEHHRYPIKDFAVVEVKSAHAS